MEKPAQACVVPPLGRHGAWALAVTGRSNESWGLIRRVGPSVGETKPAVGFTLVDGSEVSLAAFSASTIASGATGS